MMRKIWKGDFSSKIKMDLLYNFFPKPFPLQLTAQGSEIWRIICTNKMTLCKLYIPGRIIN